MKLLKILLIAAATLIIASVLALAPSDDSWDYGYEDAYADEMEAELMAYEAEMEAEPSPEEMALARQRMAAYQQDLVKENGKLVKHTPQMQRYQQSPEPKGNIRMIPLQDPKSGQVLAYMPFPGSWQMLPSGILQGPGGARIGTRAGKYSGQNISIDQAIQMDIVPLCRQLNIRIDRIVDLPRIAQKDRQEGAKYWSYAPSQDFYSAKGIETTNLNDGTRGFTVLHHVVKRSQYAMAAGYNMHILNTQPQYFEQHKEVMLYALENKQTNDQAIAAYNAADQQRASRSDAQFRQRMAAQEAAFQAGQAQYNSGKSVGDIYHEMYQNTSKMRDEGHSKSVNGIWERNAYTNPYSGQTVDLSQNYKYYYMNQFGKVIGTNDEFYNPQRDPNVNNQEWRRVPNRGN